MIKMEILKLDIGPVIMRFYLLMAVVLIGGFSGIWWISTLALPICLSTMLAIKFKINWSKKKSSKAEEFQGNMPKTEAV